MSILNLLFNPNGRIGPRDFWRGVILLVGAMIVLQVGGVYGGPVLTAVFGLLTWVMPYPYLCVYGKRLHDADKSAWWYLLAFLAYVILSTVLALVLVPLLAPGSVELQEEMTMLMEQGQWMDAFAYAPDIAKAQMIPTLVTLFASNGLIGYAVARLKSDPNENQHGLPTSA